MLDRIVSLFSALANFVGAHLLLYIVGCILTCALALYVLPERRA